MTPAAKNIVILLVIIGCIAVVYFGFIKGDTSGSDLEITNGFETADGAMTSNVAGDITSLLFQIKQLKIDNTLFENPAYQYLVDYTVEVPAIPIYRPNPFAPLGSRTTTSTSTAAAASR